MLGCQVVVLLIDTFGADGRAGDFRQGMGQEHQRWDGERRFVDW